MNERIKQLAKQATTIEYGVDNGFDRVTFDQEEFGIKQMITIKHRFSGVTLCEFDVGTIKQAAEKGKSNLRGANLYEANLVGANLDGEKLTKTPLSVVGLLYRCLISDGYMRLGCKRFTHEEWANFNDEEIKEMDDGALEFWKQWKVPLLVMCAAHRG